MSEREFETREAGALWGLYYALYYAPAQWWLDNASTLPDPIIRAYYEVQDIHRERTSNDFSALRVDALLDPVRYVSKGEAPHV